MIGSKHDIHPDDYMFRRQHSGQMESTGPALIALWPILIAGLVFLVFGALLIIRAANGSIALGGVCLALIGLAFLGAFFYLLRRDHED